MDIRIQNFGAIKNITTSIKPLTVFIGPNSTGKTWYAYTIAGIFSEYGWGEFCENYENNEKQNRYQMVENIYDQFISTGNAQVNLEKFAKQYAERYFKDLANYSKHWLNQYFASDNINLEKYSIDVSMDKENLEGVINNVFKIKVDESVGKDIENPENSILHVAKEVDSDILYFYASSDFTQKLPKSKIRHFVISNLFQLLHRSIYQYVYILPTERTTFITLPFPTRNSLISNQDKDKSEGNYSKKTSSNTIIPVGKFINTVFQCLETSSKSRKKEARSNKSIANFINLSKILESEILQGSIDFSDQEVENLRKITFTQSDNIDVDIKIVSSMIKELAPLVLFLRCMIEPDELLIIDEPEMNLHPEAQAKFIEFITILVNNGLNIILTTHSSYMIDHLSNLVKAFGVSNPESIESKFFLQTKTAFIDKNKVSINLFEKGFAKNILLENGEIDWGTFGLVSDKILDINLHI